MLARYTPQGARSALTDALGTEVRHLRPIFPLFDGLGGMRINNLGVSLRSFV